MNAVAFDIQDAVHPSCRAMQVNDALLVLPLLLDTHLSAFRTGNDGFASSNETSSNVDDHSLAKDSNDANHTTESIAFGKGCDGKFDMFVLVCDATTACCFLV